jgi:hypothetical protein
MSVSKKKTDNVTEPYSHPAAHRRCAGVVLRVVLERAAPARLGSSIKFSPLYFIGKAKRLLNLVVTVTKTVITKESPGTKLQYWKRTSPAARRAEGRAAELARLQVVELRTAVRAAREVAVVAGALGIGVLACGDRASPEKSSPKIALKRRTAY